MLFLSLALTLLTVPICKSESPSLFQKFEYKHSFRTPNLALHDGTIAFWTIAGDAKATNDLLRLAPSMRSRKGCAWNTRPMVESQWFEVEMSLKVSGQGRLGADGMAIWYTTESNQLGPVFGSKDHWTGMALFLDSFDNDGQKNNPFVSVMINDGTRSFDHQTDGSQHILGGCQKNFRNKPYPVKTKISYVNNVLTVLVDDGMSQHPRYEPCIRTENVVLPLNGYFGLSAGTGGLADDHDVFEFSVFSLKTEAQQVPNVPLRDDREKYNAEFEKQMREYEQDRQRYKDEHPDKATLDEDADEFAKYFEESTARELRLIYESQNSIHLVMQQMETKLETILQQQEKHSQLLSSVRTGDHVPSTGGNNCPQLETQMSQLSSSFGNIKTYVNDIYTRTFNMEQKMAASSNSHTQGQGHVQSVGGGDLTTLRGYLEGIQTDVRQIRTNQNSMGQNSGAFRNTDSCSTCLSSTFFLMIIGGQSIILVLILIFRRRPEKAKFY